MSNLPFGALKALDNMVIARGRQGRRSPHARRSSSTAFALCPASPTIPCAWTIRCRWCSIPIPDLDQTPSRRRSSSSAAAAVGPVGAIGGVPETSTWLMGIIGFGFLSLFRRSVMSTASGPIPQSDESLKRGPGRIPSKRDPVPVLRHGQKIGLWRGSASLPIRLDRRRQDPRRLTAICNFRI